MEVGFCWAGWTDKILQRDNRTLVVTKHGQREHGGSRYRSGRGNMEIVDTGGVEGTWR